MMTQTLLTHLQWTIAFGMMFALMLIRRAAVKRNKWYLKQHERINRESYNFILLEIGIIGIFFYTGIMFLFLASSSPCFGWVFMIAAFVLSIRDWMCRILRWMSRHKALSEAICIVMIIAGIKYPGLLALAVCLDTLLTTTRYVNKDILEKTQNSMNKQEMSKEEYHFNWFLFIVILHVIGLFIYIFGWNLGTQWLTISILLFIFFWAIVHGGTKNNNDD